MMLKNAITEIDGLRFMTERLDVRSPLGRRALAELRYLGSPEKINAELDKVAAALETLAGKSRNIAVANLLRELPQVKDIRQTAARLRGGETLDDTELFEIKAFALVAENLSALMREAGISVVAIPALDEAAAMLDPDGNRIPHFYIYDSYSAELAEVRAQLKNLSAEEAETASGQALFLKNTKLEEAIREKLSDRLREYSPRIDEALKGAAELDILLAKARQAEAMGLCRPTVAADATQLKGMFNPEVREELAGRGKDFQPVDITLHDGPVLITGANMGGKTVVLKTAALVQALFQFGFYVPAASAAIVPEDRIIYLGESPQTSTGGLSSFGAEVTRINSLVESVRGGRKVLALIDEPARTTNPDEGKALVAAILDFLSENGVRSLVTSHFSGIGSHVKRLRVKGFTGDEKHMPKGVAGIQESMDYTLVEATVDGVPHEALRVARMLGMDEGITSRAAGYLEKKR